MFFIDIDKLQRETKCKPVHAVLDRYDLESASRDECLRIAVSPLCDKSVLEIDYRIKDDEENEFYVKGLSKEDLLTDNAAALLIRAAEKKWIFWYSLK